MKFVLLIAIAALLFAIVSASVDQNRDLSAPLENADVQSSIPSTGFVVDSNRKACVFDCTWFVRTARRDDPTKPCTLQRSRNGRFVGNCVQEQVCTGCQKKLVFGQQAFFLSSSDIAPRCPSFPEDLDAFTSAQLTAAKQACEANAQCTCVKGNLTPETISVRE